MNTLSRSATALLVILRVITGWLMFYAGITKILDPAWSAAGYLLNAKTFPGLFAWFAQPAVLPVTNFINEWGLTLLGVSLILGLGVRFSSVLGVILMLLYYFPVADFPFVAHGFIVDDHLIYAAALAFFAAIRAGRWFGLETWCANLPICRRFPKLHRIWG